MGMVMNKMVILFIGHVFVAHAHRVCILVPGTWSYQTSWAQPDAEFCTELAKQCDELIVFWWSAHHTHNSRMSAAGDLMKRISNLPPDISIMIVSHSHGTNVANVATQLLKQHQHPHKIESIYALATPINTETYYPHMDVVQEFYNLFSFGDLIQPVLGCFSRIYPQHERIANINITINGKDPNHCSIHDHRVAQWLSLIPKHFMDHKMNGFEQFAFHHPGTIHFYDDRPPQYEIDYMRDAWLEADRYVQNSLERMVKLSE
jgi:hypothetical protein